ncbi:hypothetical protein GmHk_14G041756 [Glycine max]|nr:hypothetical protein GmHk_14G041756 [Glycine max]
MHCCSFHPNNHASHVAQFWIPPCGCSPKPHALLQLYIHPLHAPPPIASRLNPFQARLISNGASIFECGLIESKGSRSFFFLFGDAVLALLAVVISWIQFVFNKETLIEKLE